MTENFVRQSYILLHRVLFILCRKAISWLYQIKRIFFRKISYDTLNFLNFPFMVGNYAKKD